MALQQHAIALRHRMKRAILLILLTMMAATAKAAARDPLGIFFSWGAFREPGRCFAMSEPERRRREARPYASVSYWAARGVRGQLQFHLSQPKRPESAVLLRIDDNSFQLIGGGDNAWAPDGRADAEIVAAMRTGLEMTIETRSVRGSLVRDRYGLRGAATAIDAAAVACAKR